MSKTLNVLDATGPLAWFIGWCMAGLTLAAIVCSIIISTRGNDDMTRCIDKGGTWSHTLTQPEGQGRDGNMAHYDDKCQMPGGRG